LVLGAGGVAKAIACGLQLSGVKVTVTNRNRARADELATAIGCSSIDWADRHAPGYHIIINCTSLGMHPNVDETPYDADALTPTTVVFDIVYTPEETRLIREARAR